MTAQGIVSGTDGVPSRKSRVCLATAFPQPIPYLSVVENVELPMIIAGTGSKARKAWSRELLEAVGLWERRNHNPHQLGGEQQRTAIAVGFANKPVMLLADEPTGEVDTVTSQQILDTFRRLNKMYNLTIITVTHDVRVSDQVTAWWLFVTDAPAQSVSAVCRKLL